VHGPEPLCKYLYNLLCIQKCHPLIAGFVLSTPRTSTSNSSIISNTSFTLSMNPLTATLNIRLVEALYCVRRQRSSFESEVGTIENVRQTSGESSLSTCSAWRAMDARREVGRRMSISNEQGNAESSWEAIMLLEQLPLLTSYYESKI